MATKLSLFNQALLAIKQRKLAALTDTGTSRRTLDDFYDTTVEYMLGEGLWNFAGRSVALEASVDVEPEFGYTYAFEKPEDFVRLVAISGNGDYWPTLGRYTDEGGYWNANVNPMYVRYVSNSTDYGLDLSTWTAQFERAVALELAVRIAPHVTSMGASDLATLQKQAKRELMNARSKDAVNQSADRPSPGRLVQSRMSSRGNRGLWDDV